MATNKRGDKYVVDWWTDGKRYRKFFDRQHDARDFSAKVRNDKRLGTHVAADRIPLFHEAARAWVTSRTDRAPVRSQLTARTSSGIRFPSSASAGLTRSRPR